MNVTLNMKINTYCGALYINSRTKITINARKYCQQFDTIQHAAAQRTFTFLIVPSSLQIIKPRFTSCNIRRVYEQLHSRTAFYYILKHKVPILHIESHFNINILSSMPPKNLTGNVCFNWNMNYF